MIWHRQSLSLHFSGRSDEYRSKLEDWDRHKDRPDSEFVEKMNTRSRDEAKKRTIDEVEVTEMFCPFVRGHYGDNESCRLPKTLLLMFSRQVYFPGRELTNLNVKLDLESIALEFSEN